MQLTLQNVDLNDRASIEAVMAELKAAYTKFKPKKKVIYKCMTTGIEIVGESGLTLINATGDLGKNKLTAPTFVEIGPVTRTRKAKKVVDGEEIATTNGNGHLPAPVAIVQNDATDEDEDDEDEDDDDEDEDDEE